MLKNILASIVGMVTSFMFLGMLVGILATIGVTPIGQELHSIKTKTQYEYFVDDGFELMRKSHNFSRFAILPIVALFTGLITGGLSRKGREVICSVFAMMPIIALFCFPFSLSSALLLALYVFIATIGGYVIYVKRLAKDSRA